MANLPQQTLDVRVLVLSVTSNHGAGVRGDALDGESGADEDLVAVGVAMEVLTGGLSLRWRIIAGTGVPERREAFDFGGDEPGTAVLAEPGAVEAASSAGLWSSSLAGVCCVSEHVNNSFKRPKAS